MWVFWFILLLVIGVGSMECSCKGWEGLAGSLSLITAITILTVNTLKPKPIALDVFRGNTELEITVINGVPTDTVVVFKNK